MERPTARLMDENDRRFGREVASMPTAGSDDERSPPDGDRADVIRAGGRGALRHH
jgi:hypothetical protein